MSASNSSSAKVIPFNKPKKGEFEKFRETWSRQVLADKELTHRAARVASYLVWHLNRTSRAAFPSRSEIAKGTGIDRADVLKDIKQLIARGHLQIRRPERRARRNNYMPAFWEGEGAIPPHGGAIPPHGGAIPPHGGAIPPHGGAIPPQVGVPEPTISNGSKGLEGVTSDKNTSDITSDKSEAYKQEAYKQQEAYESRTYLKIV
jgi:Helix-turn-helix domain